MRHETQNPYLASRLRPADPQEQRRMAKINTKHQDVIRIEALENVTCTFLRVTTSLPIADGKPTSHLS
jgi:hypothetical protein